MIRSKDIPLLMLVVGAAAIASFFLSNLLFGGAKNHTSKVEQVDPISAELDYIGKPYYDPAIKPLDPTKNITVDDNNNPKPLQ
jgi:hypothetical protein